MGGADPRKEINRGLTMDTHENSSGNIFADLGLSNPEQEKVKAELTIQLCKIIKNRGLTQVEAAKLLGTTQAQVSALMRGHPTSFSVGRLMKFLNRLNRHVELNVWPVVAGDGPAHMAVFEKNIDGELIDELSNDQDLSEKIPPRRIANFLREANELRRHLRKKRWDRLMDALRKEA